MLIIIGFKGPKIVDKIAQNKREKEAFERDYKDRTLRALENMAEGIAPKEEKNNERSLLENLLEGNKKLEEKRQVRQAMRDELGID